MSGVIATLPKFQFSNALGLPMSGGTLTSYLAGTTTLETTYQDEALTTANTNPITLDSRGECVIWLDSAKTYKFVLKNALGVTQWTVDNITGAGALADRLRADLAASSGASLVGYLPAGAGAVATTAQGKLREFVSIVDKGAAPGTDATTQITAALADHDFVSIPPGEFLTSGITISSNKTIKFDGGSLKSVSASSRAFTVTGGAILTIINPQLVGYRLTSDSNKANHGIVVDNGTIVLEGAGAISYFAGWGVYFVGGGSSSRISTIGSGVTITENGGGIDTGEYEFFSFDGCTITRNGLNVAKTDWSNIAGARTGWGIRGAFANGAVKNCTINENAIGLDLNSQGASNPDHGKITNNAICHNYAAGLLVQNLHSYETIIGNTILSNVVHAEAPDVTFAATGTSFDYIEVNCIGVQVAFNDIGAGSGGAIPIYGHGRCRYIGNNLIGVPFSEITHPQIGSKLYDFYGYDKNGDNLFFANMIRNENTAGLTQVILSDSVRTVVKNEIVSAGAGAGSGGGKLIDDVLTPITFAANWANVSGGQTSWVTRRGGKIVDLYVYAVPSAGASATLATLPAEYRPIANNAQLMAGVGNTLANSYATVDTSGGITITGAVITEPVLINGSYKVS